MGMVKLICFALAVIAIIIASCSLRKEITDLSKVTEPVANAQCLYPKSRIEIGSSFIINSSEQFSSLLAFDESPICKKSRSLGIDFSKRTLLGIYTQGTGCSVDFNKTISTDILKKRLVYSVDAVEQGSCKKTFFSMNWAVVPKIPQGFEVDFKVK